MREYTHNTVTHAEVEAIIEFLNGETMYTGWISIIMYSQSAIPEVEFETVSARTELDCQR